MPFPMHIEPPQAQGSHRRPGFGRGAMWTWFRLTPALAAFAVLVFGLLLTAIVSIQYERVEHRADLWQFRDTVDAMTSMIERRLRNYATVLHATAGLFEGSEQVTPEEFEVFVNRIQLETFYAGVRSIGHIRRVSADELDELAAELRRYPQEGYHNFRVAPAEGVSEHLIITHFQPDTALYEGAVGFDLAGHPRRYEAMMRSAETGNVAATPAIPLLPITDPDDPRGVAVYVPVYSGAEVTGFVFASFSTQAVMSVLLGSFPSVGFEVYDQHEESPNQLLYQANPQQNQRPQLTMSRTVSVAGQAWTIVFRRPMHRDIWLPALPIAGITVSMTIAGIIWRLAKAREATAQNAEQLRRQREWFAVTLGSIGDAVLATDAKGRVTFMNERAQQLTGWSMQDAQGQAAENVLRLADEQTGAEFPNPVPETLRQLKATELREGTVLIHRNGTQIPIDDSGAPIRSGHRRHNEIIGAVITFRDVSERRRHQKALQESQDRLHFVLDSAEIGDWDLDVFTGVLQGSHRHDQLFGYAEPSGSWSYQRFLDHVHEEDRAYVASSFDESAESGCDCDLECRIVWPDQSIHWVEVHGSIYKYEQGRPRRMLGLMEDISQRKQTEEDLRRSEERFRVLVTATSSILWTSSDDGVSYEAQSWEDFTGQTREQYLGDGWLDALHPDDRARVMRAWDEVRRSKSAFQIAYRLQHRSGEYRRVSVRGVPLLDEDSGDVREWVGSISDVEEQERVAEALLRAEQRFRWIVESSIDFAIFTFDLDGKIDSWNSGAERVLGYQEDDILGKDVQVIFTAEDQDNDQPARERHEALAGVSSMDERWHVRADGELFFAAGRVMTLHDDLGNVHGFVKILHDRTKEHQAQEALQRRTDELQVSEARFRTMADSAPVYIWTTDTSKACTWINQPWLDYTGRSMQEELVYGRLEGMHPDDEERYFRVYNEHFDARLPFKVKYRLRRREADYHWLLDHGVPLYGPNGNFAGYIGSCMDITELEQARETLERYSTDLQRLVNERTARLRESNEQLRISERMASLGTLAAGIGHDLGNLLLPMRIRLDIIEHCIPESERDSVSVIRTATEYLANLAKGLRYLSIDPDTGENSSGKTDLSTWWSETQPLLRNTLPKNVQLEHDFPDGLPPVKISAAALTQAVFNLVQNSGNALRDASAGTIRVWAEVDTSSRGDARYVRLAVTDDGPGMSEEVKRRCLEPFFSTKTREFSTGLGLPLVQGAVQRADGRVQVQSELGRGTTITLVLPVISTEFEPERDGQPGTAALLVTDARIGAFVAAELHALGFRTSVGGTFSDLSLKDANLLVVDVAALMQDDDTFVSQAARDSEKIFKEFLEQNHGRTIVILRHPNRWGDFLQDTDDQLIRTSSTFRPSEIHEALRKAAVRYSSGTSLTHAHRRIHH